MLKEERKTLLIVDISPTLTQMIPTDMISKTQKYRAENLSIFSPVFIQINLNIQLLLPK